MSLNRLFCILRGGGRQRPLMPVKGEDLGFFLGWCKELFSAGGAQLSDQYMSLMKISISVFKISSLECFNNVF